MSKKLERLRRINQNSLLYVTVGLILAGVYTKIITGSYRSPRDGLQANIFLFGMAIFFLSLSLLVIIFRLLRTRRFSNLRFVGLLAVIISIGILGVGLPFIKGPVGLIVNHILLPLWIIWAIIVFYPKLGRHYRYPLLTLPLLVPVAVFIFHQFVPNISCSISGGDWVTDGVLGQAQYCLYEFPDGGQTCTSSDECLGDCMVYEWVLPDDDPPEYGFCKATTRPFGCYASIEFPELFVCTD